MRPRGSNLHDLFGSQGPQPCRARVRNGLLVHLQGFSPSRIAIRMQMARRLLSRLLSRPAIPVVRRPSGSTTRDLRVMRSVTQVLRPNFPHPRRSSSLVGLSQIRSGWYLCSYHAKLSVHTSALSLTPLPQLGKRRSYVPSQALCLLVHAERKKASLLERLAAEISGAAQARLRPPQPPVELPAQLRGLLVPQLRLLDRRHQVPFGDDPCGSRL